MKVDLHIHTNASDGCWTPERLIKKVVEKGIGIFSVTDHDTIENISSAQKLAQDAGVIFIPGVEISATLNGRLFHILGYGIEPANPGLQDILTHNTGLMNKNDDDSIRRLIERGYDIEYNQYLSYHNDTTRGGWKALNFLMDIGLCTGMDDFFRTLFGHEPAPYPIFPHPEEIIEAIVGAGGIPILAHPGGSVNKKSSIEEVLAAFLELGIQGIESFHPEHDIKKTKICLDWSRRNKRQITGGSDCHGGFISSRQLGLPDIEVEQLKLKKLEEYL